MNYFLKVKNTDDGIKLFGKAGYQTMNPKADKFVNTNLETVLKLWKAGELKDLEGNVCTIGDGRTPVIDVYASISLISDDTTIEEVDGVRNSAGGMATLPFEAPAAEAGDEPF
jgi:hypothetical protein